MSLRHPPRFPLHHLLTTTQTGEVSGRAEGEASGGAGARRAREAQPKDSPRPRNASAKKISAPRLCLRPRLRIHRHATHHGSTRFRGTCAQGEGGGSFQSRFAIGCLGA